MRTRRTTRNDDEEERAAGRRWVSRFASISRRGRRLCASRGYARRGSSRCLQCIGRRAALGGTAAPLQDATWHVPQAGEVVASGGHRVPPRRSGRWGVGRPWGGRRRWQDNAPRDGRGVVHQTPPAVEEVTAQVANGTHVHGFVCHAEREPIERHARTHTHEHTQTHTHFSYVVSRGNYQRPLACRLQPRRGDAARLMLM